MNAQQPPALATWLLERLGSGPAREALAGDLVEQYRHGRTDVWYWRQVLSAILVGAARDIRAHKLLAVRALVIGWVLYVLFSFPVNWLSGILRVSINTWLVDAGHASFWWLFWGARLPATLLVYLACAGCGWMVGRFHRAHSGAVVCLLSASVLLFEYGFMSWMLFWYGHPPVPQAVLIFPMFMAVGRPLSVLIGGLSVAPDGPSVGRLGTS